MGIFDWFKKKEEPKKEKTKVAETFSAAATTKSDVVPSLSKPVVQTSKPAVKPQAKVKTPPTPDVKRPKRLKKDFVAPGTKKRLAKLKKKD